MEILHVLTTVKELTPLGKPADQENNPAGEAIEQEKSPLDKTIDGVSTPKDLHRRALLAITASTLQTSVQQARAQNQEVIVTAPRHPSGRNEHYPLQRTPTNQVAETTQEWWG